MSAALLKKRFLVPTALAGLVVFSGVFAKQAVNEAEGDLQPTRQHVRASKSVVDQLANRQYGHIVLNDAQSSKVFDKYLKDLDGGKSYFIASDIKSFQPYRLSLDDALKKGDLAPAFTIYNVYQKRSVERLTFILAELDKGLVHIDYTKNESLETDREKSPWAKNVAELDELWRKRLKAATLSLRMAGKNNEDIQKTLTKRYRSQLTQLKQTKPDDAFQVFMNAFTQTYDPHTEYFSPRTSENFNINMSLSLEGIGAVLQTDDEFTKIVRLVPAGPADKSQQVKTGDRIVAVAQGDDDFVDVVGWRIDEVVALIRGRKGTTVRLQLIPAGATDEHTTKVASIVRNTVELEDQAAQKKILDIKQNGKSYKIGVIKLPTFYADFQAMQDRDPNYRSTTRDVKRLINELKAEKINGLVLDLRNNGGGSLSESNSLVGLFIETGPTVQVKGSNSRIEVLSDPDNSVTYTGPLVVLTNRLSASAAEIFAGAIQDYGRGIVVGNTSFGKGTVQSLNDISYGQLKITEAMFYRISGASTQNRGIIADIKFPNIFDEKELGESALPNALPWDSIPAARYFRYSDFSKKLPLLRELSQQRQNKNPDFIYLNDQIALLDTLKNKTVLSLNELTRDAEKNALDLKRLDIENRRREAKGQQPLKNWKEAEIAEEADLENPDPNKDKPEDEAFLVESGHILADILRLSSKSDAAPPPGLQRVLNKTN